MYNVTILHGPLIANHDTMIRALTDGMLTFGEHRHGFGHGLVNCRPGSNLGLLVDQGSLGLACAFEVQYCVAMSGSA